MKSTNLSLYHSSGRAWSSAKWEKVGNSSWSPQTILEAPGLGARARKMWTGAKRLFGELPRKGGQDFLAWFSRRGANEFEGQFRGWGVNRAVSMAPGAWRRSAPLKLWRNNWAVRPARPEEVGGREAGRDGGGAVTCALGARPLAGPGANGVRRSGCARSEVFSRTEA